jgi:hypothetical protein
MKGNTEKDLINKRLKASGNSAYKKALSSGITVTVLIDNNVCRIDPNGETTVIKQIDTGVRKKLNPGTIKIKLF